MAGTDEGTGVQPPKINPPRIGQKQGRASTRGGGDTFPRGATSASRREARQPRAAVTTHLGVPSHFLNRHLREFKHPEPKPSREEKKYIYIYFFLRY